MAQVHFTNQVQYEFAARFFEDAGGTLPGATLRPDNMIIETNEPTILLLLKRISEGHTAIMPYFGKNNDTWMIAGAHRRDLDQTMRYLKRLLIPTYAAFTPSGHLPQIHQFDSVDNPFQQAGAVVYPVGYYRLVSRANDRTFILERLALWLGLEARRPMRQAERHHTYRDLADTFDAALAGANWQEAANCLHEMQRLNLSTADNLAFLEIQLFAQQHRWSEIWKHGDFSLLAKMRVPRVVRAALLTAFHHTELLKLEQASEWTRAFETFKANRPKLGLLLTGRFGLSQRPVILVFAYQAVLDKDRASLDALRTVADDQQVQHGLDNLEAMLPMQPAIPEPLLTPQQRIKQALLLSDYDTALRVIDDIEQPVERSMLLIEIAFHSGDVRVAEDAMLAFWELADDIQQQINQEHPRIPHYLGFLEQLIAPASDTAVPAIGNWSEWFQTAYQQPEHPSLTSALEYLARTGDEQFWKTEQIVDLTNAVFQYITHPECINQAYARTALHKLISIVLQDQAFPRSDEAYDTLYETLYTGVLDILERNVTTSMTMLRLVESLLANKPQRCHDIWNNLSTWFHQPVPVLETSVLEAIELLTEYGLPGGSLTECYRRWVEYLLSLPMQRDRTSLEVWLAIGTWIQTVPDLVSKLQHIVTDRAEQDADDPIEHLPADFVIGIFSLRESSAQRVKAVLEARNQALDIRICTETVLNDQAKSLAQKADLVVVVWTCVSHALTYGIEPFLKHKPVFPQSSGSTSMIHAIEERVRTLLNESL
jgi:hypothetical protein